MEKLVDGPDKAIFGIKNNDYRGNEMKKDNQPPAKEEKAISKVRKSNVFVDGRYRFNFQEQKIMLQIISKVKMNETEFADSYFVSWEELKKISKDNLNSVAKIDASCEKLKNKTIKIRTGNVQDNFGFLSGWKTTVGQGVHFRIDSSMKKMLLNLLNEGNFTLYNLECALALPSSHSIRLYELLKSHEWKEQPVILRLDDIKWSLDILEVPSYADFGFFRVHILEKAQKALKANTDISFEYYPIKEGKRVVALEIHIKKNHQKTIAPRKQKATTAIPKAGDIIVIAGDEYEFTGSGIYMNQTAIPAGVLIGWIKEGRATIK